MSPKNYIGLIIIFLVLITLGGFAFLQSDFNFFNNSNQNSETQTQVVKGYLGWEKRGFFEDQKVKNIFEKDYGLIVEINKKGSIEMVTQPDNQMDYLFPSNRIALELFQERSPEVGNSQIVFFSPIVVYSWDSLVPDLVSAGLVTETNGVLTLDLDKLLLDIESGKTWQDIGSNQLQGPLTIASTDPSKSSSGNLFTALVLNSFANKNTAVTSQDVTLELENRVKNLFSTMGLLDSSSGDIFDKFLTLGRSTFPFVVGYESQFIELIQENPKLAESIAVLYPKSTVWAEHSLISLNSNGDKLIQAINNNQQLGQIAWNKYGLRLTGYNVDSSRFSQYGIDNELDGVIPLPKFEVIEKIIDLD